MLFNTVEKYDKELRDIEQEIEETENILKKILKNMELKVIVRQ